MGVFIFFLIEGGVEEREKMARTMQTARKETTLMSQIELQMRQRARKWQAPRKKGRKAKKKGRKKGRKSARESGKALKKPHAGAVVVLRESLKRHKATQLLREIARDFKKSNVRFRLSALATLQEAAEAYLVGLLHKPVHVHHPC